MKRRGAILFGHYKLRAMGRVSCQVKNALSRSVGHMGVLVTRGAYARCGREVACGTDCQGPREFACRVARPRIIRA